MLISDFVKSNTILFLRRLTAFVAKSFAQARAFIPEYIDTEMLEQSLAWMSRQTNRDGSFKKVGTVHSSYLKVDNLLLAHTLWKWPFAQITGYYTVEHRHNEVLSYFIWGRVRASSPLFVTSFAPFLLRYLALINSEILRTCTSSSLSFPAYWRYLFLSFSGECRQLRGARGAQDTRVGGRRAPLLFCSCLCSQNKRK